MKPAASTEGGDSNLLGWAEQYPGWNTNLETGQDRYCRAGLSSGTFCRVTWHTYYLVAVSDHCYQITLLTIHAAYAPTPCDPFYLATPFPQNRFLRSKNVTTMQTLWTLYFQLAYWNKLYPLSMNSNTRYWWSPKLDFTKRWAESFFAVR